MNDATGKNGVVIKRRAADTGDAEYRTYEIYQRERVGESTALIRPTQLAGPEYQANPHPLLGILREHYPCYRDWLSNSYWITRYNDVTSIFTDDANFETRPKAWGYRSGSHTLAGKGRNFNGDLALEIALTQRMDELVEPVTTQLCTQLKSQSGVNWATAFAARLPVELLAAAYGIPVANRHTFSEAFWKLQRGRSFDPALREAGFTAWDNLVTLLTDLQRSSSTGEETVIDVLTRLGADANDIAMTLLETDHETLHGGLASLWCLLLTHPAQFEKARSEQRMMKLAWLETLRLLPPVISADRFARHEVERFGRLLPQGARLICSAAAANRDPSIFTQPDEFQVDRQDLCQREPRGQYRADGLASGIAFALGKPSPHPAVPEDRPRSRYALARDTAVSACDIVLQHFPDIALKKNATPLITSLTSGEMYTCWQLPVVLR